MPVAAKTFPTEKIRNVALVGHGGSGKTSLAEALLYSAGAIPRLGTVEDGNTTTDFDPEEARRRISVSLALAPFEHDGHKVNVIDTPGYADFVSDVAAALRVPPTSRCSSCPRSRASRCRPRWCGGWPTSWACPARSS